MSTLTRKNSKKEAKRIEKELKALGVVKYYTDIDGDVRFDAKVKELLKEIDFNSINASVAIPSNTRHYPLGCITNDNNKQLHENAINVKLAGLDIDYDMGISVSSFIK